MSTKKVVITQSNYIPWKGYFDNIHVADELVLYDDMQYTRRDWRNRNIIKTPNGPQWLTIPVEVKGKYFQKINETRISDPRWGDAHWKTIQFNYNKALHFKDYKDVFEELYRDNTTDMLSLVNHRFIKAICDILRIPTTIRWSSEFELTGDKTERLVNICKELKATDYYTGPASKAYMDEALFEEANIKVHYFDYSGYPEYNQLYGEFIHGVTILDLLFNEGEDSPKFMKSFNGA